MRTRKCRGVVLIIVLGVLVILALLATTFASLQSIERQTVRNYLDTVRAKLIAQSGVEYAWGELQAIHRQGLLMDDAPSQAWRFWGNDITETDPASSTTNLHGARNPSFAMEKDRNPLLGSPEPETVTIEGRPYGYSGVLSSSTYARNGDLYTIKVTDPSGKIYINEGLLQYRGNDSAGSRNLRRILNRLGAAVTPAVPGLGDRIVPIRPPAGYKSLIQLLGPLDKKEYDRVKEFLTTNAWVDPRVVSPVPFTADHAATIKQEFGIEYYRGQPAAYRFGRGKDYLGNLVGGTLKVYPSVGAAGFVPNSLQHAVYAMDELNPQWIETVPRAPVNVNAAPREVLVALLSDLRGVFLSERRRNNIETSKVGAYHFLKVRHSYSPANMPMPPAEENPLACYNVPEGDELGFLYETYPIVGPGGTASGISAFDIADEIIACREKKTSPGAPGCDYGNPAAAPFGGPFRTWRQFNAFCDNLVRLGILQDPRPIFYDYQPQPIDYGNITGNAPLIPSDFQRQVASRAIADVLKANFNPNVHLNELNPDRNMYLLVDKTDLVVNSTEFIFTPTGYYDIESIGYVLRPTAGEDAMAADNKLIAVAKVEAGVKLFDLVRHTAQSQFARGECSGRAEMPVTNNDLSLEIGPEPDNGNGPLENDWGGYLALPTVGGIGEAKPPGEAPRGTPVGASEWGETIHAHLSRDFDAHYHADGNDKRRDMGSAMVGPGDGVVNYSDPDPNTPNVEGPYDPTDNGGNYYRLARSFTTFRTGSSGTAALPPLGIHAPLDLRVDGGYLERHAGLAYWISPTSYVPNAAAKQGAIAYWVKPNFDPARSGKPRLYADMTRHATMNPQLPNEWFKGAITHANFINFWNAGHDVTPLQEDSSIEYQSSWMEYDGAGGPTISWGVLPFKPQAMTFGIGYGSNTRMCGLYYQWMITPSLNHVGHSDNAPTVFDAHEWTHIILSWKKSEEIQTNQGPDVPNRGTYDYKVLVNSKLLSGSVDGLLNNGATTADPTCPDTAVDWTVHPGGCRNSLRFGATSRVVTGPETYYHNFSPDSTLDEIFFWNQKAQETEAIHLWLLGRYACPRTTAEGVFTSAPITFEEAVRRILAPSSSSTTIPEPAPSAPSSFRILGVSWTWFAEPPEPGPGGAWVPVLTDHGADGGKLYPEVELSFPSILGLPPVRDDGFGILRDASGNPPTIPPGSPLQYRMAIRVPGAGLSTILLTTPVIDDVTIYFDGTENVNVYTYYQYVTLVL